jgi:tRNA nucleotidyltransferase (CCA-adding enzyme)
MLRAVRFASELNFSVSNSLIKTMENINSRIEIVTNERIVDELNKILLSKKI